MSALSSNSAKSVPPEAVRLPVAAGGGRLGFANRLVSAVTVGGMTLLSFGLAALLLYWLMLPVRLRWGALGIIVGLLLVGGWRLARLWRRSPQPQRAPHGLPADPATPPSAAVSSAD